MFRKHAVDEMVSVNQGNSCDEAANALRIVSDRLFVQFLLVQLLECDELRTATPKLQNILSLIRKKSDGPAKHCESMSLSSDLS